jgi:hypothetical protein
VPFVISAATRKYWGINYYPGEIGLRKHPATAGNQPDAQKSFVERHFPYIAQTLKNGNPVPFVLSLLPLPFAMGVFNTVGRYWLKPWEAGFGKKLLRTFDFQKAKPFTAQQQMASVFALLITSRLWNSRSDNEFRERMVDSFLGWGLWILGTPLIKKGVAWASDRWGRTALLNEKGALRSREEIKHLLTSETMVNGKTLGQQLLDKTYHRNIALGIGSTIATMLLLGIVEPWIGIRWTQVDEKKKQAVEAARQRPVQSWSPFPLQPHGRAAFNGAPLQPFGRYGGRSGQTGPFPAYGVATVSSRVSPSPFGISNTSWRAPLPPTAPTGFQY